MSDNLREHIDQHMPYIDELLAEQNIPIHMRFIHAGVLFFEAAVLDSNFGSNKELLESEVYRECVLPLFNDWYFEKYGDLAQAYTNDFYSGMVLVHGQPVSVRIPVTTTSVIEEGRLAKMAFPDHLQESEKFDELIQPKFDLGRLGEESVNELRCQVEKVVALTRSINLHLNMSSNLGQPVSDMAQGIWRHFEKAISDIITLRHELSSVACWEIHLAIEKSLKVLIFDKSGKREHGHNLDGLIDSLGKYDKGIDSSRLSTLPSDKDAIKLRYAEMIRSPVDAFIYYLVALEFVDDIASRLEHDISIKNASFTLKMAPWAR